MSDSGTFPNIVVRRHSIQRQLIILILYAAFHGLGAFGRIVDFDSQLLEILHGNHLNVV